MPVACVVECVQQNASKVVEGFGVQGSCCFIMCFPTCVLDVFIVYGVACVRPGLGVPHLKERRGERRQHIGVWKDDHAHLVTLNDKEIDNFNRGMSNFLPPFIL